MGDEEDAGCKVVYMDLADGNNEETNWIKRAGKAMVTYPNGCTFTGKCELFHSCVVLSRYDLVRNLRC